MACLLLASAAHAAPGPYVKPGNEVVNHVRTRFLDPKKAEAWATKHRGYGAAASSAEDFARRTNAALAELGTSHTTLYPRGSAGHTALTAIFGNSRSGKEMVAFTLKRHKRGTLVGQRTAGAVLAGAPLPLSNGDLLYLAVMDVEVEGVRLEGTGVPVDVEVPEALPYAAGKDPQLDKALDVAASAAGRR